MSTIKFVSREKAQEALKGWWGTYLRNYKMIFFVLFFGVGIWGAFLWYYSLYYYHWSDAQKQQYKNEKSKDTTLNIDGFQKVIDVLGVRNEKFSAEKEKEKSYFVAPLTN